MESENVRGYSYCKMKKVWRKKSKVTLLVGDRPGLELDSQADTLSKVLLKVKWITIDFYCCYPHSQKISRVKLQRRLFLFSVLLHSLSCFPFWWRCSWLCLPNIQCLGATFNLLLCYMLWTVLLTDPIWHFLLLNPFLSSINLLSGPCIKTS